MKKLKIGSNQYKTKRKYPLGLNKRAWKSFWKSSLVLIFFTILLVAVHQRSVPSDRVISPLPDNYIPERVIVIKEAYAVDRNKIDASVDKAAEQFGKGKGGYSDMKKTLHCLLYYETKHGYDKGHGDNGKAGGILQFHEPTWQRMRKKMIKQGLVEDISNRYDEHNAIMTTAWAISEGRGSEWGPILRGECQ